MRPGIKPASSLMLVRFLSTEPQKELHFFLFVCFAFTFIFPGFFLLILHLINLHFSKLGYRTYYTNYYITPPPLPLQWDGEYPIPAFSRTVALTAKAETPAECELLRSSQWSCEYCSLMPTPFFRQHFPFVKIKAKNKIITVKVVFFSFYLLFLTRVSLLLISLQNRNKNTVFSFWLLRTSPHSYPQINYLLGKN